MKILTGVEVCAGAGGQALGLAMAGFVHTALVEYEEEYCKILSQNRPEWPVICGDLHDFDGKPYRGVDLLSGGVPCPPFSVAGKQLGKDDERDLFPEALRLTEEINPKAVMLENVRGFLDPSFAIYREQILNRLDKLGYNTHTALYNFYAASEVDETSLHKACTKSVGFFAVWALETKVPKNISRCICQLIWLLSSCGLAFWYFAKCSSRYGSIFRLL